MSLNDISLCLVFHNHQPIGNFHDVFEAAYRDSYLPFLDVFEPYQELSLSLHTSGSLMEWLDANHPDYVDRLAALVAEGRVEIVGGAFFEPILPMIPPRDRVGQIVNYSRWLQNRLGATVRGMWIPERVWEASLTSDLSAAEIEYTILDDYHFKAAGLTESQLHGYFVTEDDGRLLKIFPGSERLRYLIPFHEPEATIDHLRQVAESHPGAVCVFGDDGEKFGTWPETKTHVYENGWLKRFFDALVANREWLHTTTLDQALASARPLGKIYLPDGSYREMTEWALPVRRQIELESVHHELEHDANGDRVRSFLRGGFWRNFKVKYSESDEMYSRMMAVSSLLQQAENEGIRDPNIEAARQHLYRGQCNCSYWHGAFGGLYLPHLRNAVYHHLITAENLLDAAKGRPNRWVEATADDFNFDGRPEVRLGGDQLIAWFSPSAGGRMYELDVREIGHNLLATMQRRPEAYHEKVRSGENSNEENAASIHDRVVFKQADLDQRLFYDDRPPKSLTDHFWDDDIDPLEIASGTAMERGDFADGEFTSTIRRSPDRIRVEMMREGNAWGVPLKLTKAVTLNAGSDELEIGYQIEGLPADREFLFGVEFNFAGLPAGAEDRYFHHGDQTSIGQLETKLDLADIRDLSLCDRWLGIDVSLSFDAPTSVWTYPIETVSQSEAGFELVHQSVVVQPHWKVEGDESGRWVTSLRLKLDTSVARQRRSENHENHDRALPVT